MANVGRLQAGRQRYWLLAFLEQHVGQKEEALGGEIEPTHGLEPLAQARREEIEESRNLGLGLDEFISVCLGAMQDIATLLDISLTEVGALTGFYTLYHDKQEGKYRMQVCTDLPCALRGAEVFVEQLCENLGIKVGETTPDGLVMVEEVTCLAGCDRAPMFQLQSATGLEYHENMTIDKTMELVEALRKTGKEVK